MPYSSASGVRIYYEVAGEGRPFVFVHANPFDHRMWLHQVAHFSPYYQVISVDLRGYGRSDKPESAFTLADMAGDVIGVCRAEGIERAMFCGCSVGSGIALLIGLDQPQMVEALILVGGNSRGSANVARRVLDLSKTTDLPGFLRGYIRELVAPDFPATARGRWLLNLFTENAQTLSAKCIANIHLARNAADMSGRLAELDAPTLVINGAHDNSLAAGTETARRIRGAQHVVLAGTGHACPIEDPESFDKAVIDFLAAHGLWSGPGGSSR
ncbi:MAG TPA: alpha/beta hydrolase [Hyphomicrobiaceae bacterium]|nr:alpha/beta hydrolase [Hyphomicrobiaceae bacterium]